MRSTAIILAALVGILCVSAARIGSKSTVQGRVTTELGQAIGRAHLLFHFDPAGQEKPQPRPDVVVEADSAGRFEVQLQPGFYDMCTFSSGFTATCQKLLLRGAEPTRREIRLKADPLVTEHLGDVFFR